MSLSSELSKAHAMLYYVSEMRSDNVVIGICLKSSLFTKFIFKFNSFNIGYIVFRNI